MILAIICCRGGSKGVPGKNIRPLRGKPLIAYTIASAKASKLIGDLIISTDDAQIADVAKTKKDYTDAASASAAANAAAFSFS